MQQPTYIELKIIKKLFALLRYLKAFSMGIPASADRSVSQLSTTQTNQLILRCSVY